MIRDQVRRGLATGLTVALAWATLPGGSAQAAVNVASGVAPTPGAPGPHPAEPVGPEKPSLPAAADAAAKMSAGASPGWVSERPYDRAASSEERIQGHPTEILLLDYQARGFDAPEYFTHVVTRILTADGVDELGEISVDFDPGCQSLVWHRLSVRRGDEVIDQLDIGRIRLLQRETNLDAKMFDGFVSAIALLQDLRPGDEVDYAYSIVGDNPIFGGRLTLAYFPAMSSPVREFAVRVLDRTDRTLVHQVQPSRIAPLLRDRPRAPLPAVTVQDTAAGREYSWHGRDLESLELEGEAPDWFDPWPRIELNQYADWAAVTAWAVDLYALPDDLPAELEARIRAWQREHSDRAKLAEVAVRFVQDEIRYLGIEAGENSHRPHPPAEVYAHRFGDCKDKTTLAVALLRRLGVKAWPALVSSTGGPEVPEYLPSPFVFDHVIVAYELGGGLRYVDPTRQRQGGKLADSVLPPFDWTLLVRPGEKALTVIPRPKYEAPLRHVRERFDWDGTNAPVRLRVETVYLGPEADQRRDELARTPRARLAMRYLNFYARRFGGIELAAEPTWTDDRLRNRLTIQESYTIADFWTESTSGEGTWHAVLTPGEIAELVQKPRELRRRSPLAVAWPIHLRETVELSGPKRWEESSREAKAQCPAFVFTARRSAKGKVLTMDYTFRGTTDAVAPEGMRPFITALDEVVDHADDLCVVEVAELPATKSPAR